MLSHLIGHCRIKATLVIGPSDSYGVDQYEIPAGLRERIMLRDSIEIFPFSARTARACQLDHTIPYTKDGPPVRPRPRTSGHFLPKPIEARPTATGTSTNPTGDLLLEITRRVPLSSCQHGTRMLGHGDRCRQALDDYLWDRDRKPDTIDP